MYEALQEKLKKYAVFMYSRFRLPSPEDIKWVDRKSLIHRVVAHNKKGAGRKIY